MEDQFEKLTRLELKVYLMKVAKRSLESDTNFIRTNIQAMRRWVKREFMTEEDEKQLKKALDLKSTLFNILKDLQKNKLLNLIDNGKMQQTEWDSSPLEKLYLIISLIHMESQTIEEAIS